jgi:hypothetical protein
VIDDRTVPLVVLALVVIIAFLARPVARSSGLSGPRPKPGAEAVARLAEALGIGIIVHEVEEGPPAWISASLLLDTAVSRVVASGDTENEAWEDLARKATAWKNDDPRNVRTYLGGV